MRREEVTRVGRIGPNREHVSLYCGSDTLLQLLMSKL